MVLPKERGSQDSLSIHSGTAMMRSRASNACSMASGGPSCLNLSTLTLSDNISTTTSHQSGTQLSSFAQNGNQATLRRGWGSAETRRASTSLSSMAGKAQEYSSVVPSRRPIVDTNAAPEKDGWGYFVDVAEDDDEDVLMW